ncbi:MAG: hypothetical protein ABR505_12140 [Actinomycetota bacterium]
MDDSRTIPSDTADEGAGAWRDDLYWSVRRLGAGIGAGFLVGLIVGGIGGRLAMFVLRLTSDPLLRGVETDDGFRIGAFTQDTLFLLLVGGALGVLGGLFYLTVRSWLPARRRPLLMAALAATVGGSLVIHPDGIDFRVLDPLSLALAMFILLPGLYGFAVSVLAEKLLLVAEGPRFAGLVWSWFPVLALFLAGPIGLVVLIVMGLGWALNRVSNFTTIWTSPGMAWVGRGALLAGGLFALYTLGKDIAELV